MRGKTILAALALVVALGLTAGVGTVAAVEEVENSTVTVTNDTDSVYADVAWNETAGTDNVTADVYLEDSDGTEVASRTINAVDNDSVLTEFDADSNDLNATDYTVRVEVADGESGYVESVEVGTFEQVAGGGGIADGALSLGVGPAIVGLLGAAGIGILRGRN
jgi:hypothetical protein